MTYGSGGYGPDQGYGAPQQQMQPWSQPHLQRSCCEACGRDAPTKQVTLMQNVGLLIVRFPKTISGQLCKRCISSNFWSMTAITFFFGWWGIISFFYSLISIPTNIVAMIGASSLPDEHPAPGVSYRAD